MALRLGVLVAITGSLLVTVAATAPAAPVKAGGTPDVRALGTALAAERAAARGIRFGPCPENLHLDPPTQCGTVRVPLDYARPDGEQITLTVSRARASGADAEGRPVKRQGSLVFRTGSPGTSGIYFPMVAGLRTWQRMHAAYDLVGYTPRGVGRAAPLSCQDPGRFTAAPTDAPRRPDPSQKNKRRAQARAYARGCLWNAGERLRHYSTRDNARDLDVLRAALGERRLTFMGVSYGGQVGAVYATLFPRHVRRMVFDSVPDPAPEQVGYPTLLRQSAAFQRRWQAFLGWVARHDKAYGLGTTAAAVQRAYDGVHARLTREAAGGIVGPGQLQAAFTKVVYYDDYWPLRATALAAFVDGEPDFLIQQASPVPEAAKERENTAAVSTAVRCNDSPWPRSWTTWDRDATRLARTAPFAAWDQVWPQLPCASWPLPGQRPVDVRTAPGRLPPTLVLAAEHDAVSPYPGARELHRRIAGSVLVTERGAGMTGVGGGPNDCVNGYLDDYLVEGRLPAEDARCAPHPQPRPLATGGRAAFDVRRGE
ncbi:alpha/beta fold hydrolase [Streptomyces sp. NA04227]|uniref:alpha/beta hydrolase n=1 Tax=Streptomyces sp. NA04227 TaxID=2742136 RepID=UPI001591B8CF|nr:alpha/beta hydrolase [Streptomyces sp. NA04227]QKW09900.1 alpha/beta fold hydrolase [Streptomyces sp. NA04227]